MDLINKKNEPDKNSADQIEISEPERRRIEENIERSDAEKFHLFCRLMRIQIMLENAVVTHK